MVSAVYVHNLDPFLIEFGNGIGLRWYGLSYVMGFLAAYWLLQWLIRRGATPLEAPKVGDLVLAVAVGTVVGGRVGYCLFYQQELLIRFDSAPPFWGLLMINEGGMASHGGMIGIAAACIWFARKHGLRPLHVLDLAVVTGPIGVFFGRLANFINGELFGRPCDPELPWSVKFPQEVALWGSPEHPKHHVYLEAKQMILFDTESTAGGCSPDTGWAGRIVEAARNNSELLNLIEPHLMARHPSQIYQALLEGALVFAFLILMWRKPRKPGLLGCWFLIGYAAMRIVGEQFRMPDAHIGYQWLQLTRGQWLSFGMVAAGLVLWAVVARRGDRPMGGWGRISSSQTASSDPDPERPDQGANP
ncbi:MAG: prolipoprotein diacylglyceryl transferase [Phycisphaeraceae bacterium]|nr:prolipoprotein diacylglyceryl transferase [Phycisphaeraceae bacterium]